MPSPRFARPLAAALAVGVLSFSAPAQPSSLANRVYRLVKTSGYQEGCFGACQCPVFFNDSLTGMFVLTPALGAATTADYAITNAKLVASGTVARSFTGSGEYHLTLGSGPALGYSGTMSLTLSQPDQPTYVFKGGPSPEVGGIPFPPIDITIDRNNMVCYDQVLHIVAKPVSADWNESGRVTVQDIFSFLSDWFAGDPAANYSGSGALGVQDVFDFLADWFAGV